MAHSSFTLLLLAVAGLLLLYVFIIPSKNIFASPPIHVEINTVKTVKRLSLQPAVRPVIEEPNFEDYTIIYDMIQRHLNMTPNMGKVSKVFRNLQTTKKRKLILLYTTFFGARPWFFLKQEYFSKYSRSSSPIFNCNVSTDKLDFNKSDAVMFHLRDMPSAEHLREMLKIKPPHQRWVFFLLENPFHLWLDLRNFNGMFNWTMTYATNSDIFFPYGAYHEITTKVDPDQDFTKGKDKLLFWSVSHCGLPREKVAVKLKEYIPIDIFGACKTRIGSSTPGLTCKRSTKACDQLERRYKFRLSFENRPCKDYVTEKYWDALRQGNVPIVLGGANYTDPSLVIPGSYINVLDFPSLKVLADYIKYLDKNNTAYNEYFNWRKRYKATQNHNYFGYGLCGALNLKNSKPKVYNDIDKFWGIDESCIRNDERLRRLIS